MKPRSLGALLLVILPAVLLQVSCRSDFNVLVSPDCNGPDPSRCGKTPTCLSTPPSTPSATPTPTQANSPTPTPAPQTLCRDSSPDQNLVYFDAGGAVPPLDGAGLDWTQAGYNPSASWGTPSIVTNPPQPEWNLTCGPDWISSLPSGLPSTLADTYYRNSFTLPPGTSPAGSLTFSVDDGADIYVDGILVGSYPGSLTSPDATRPYHVCATLAIPNGVFQPGKNVIAFQVTNLMTYEGLNYSLCMTQP